MKKFLLPALIVIIIIQLFVPAYMIANRYYILNIGEEYKFRVNPIDPYDAFRGRYVSLYVRVNATNTNGKYGTIVVDGEGFATINKVLKNKPKNAAYVKSSQKDYFRLPIDRYYMEEKMAPKAESIVRRRVRDKDAYVTVRVKNGDLVISGLYIDAVPIEDIIKDETKN